MADSAPLAGLLDRAGRVFSLTDQLGHAFRDEYDRQGNGVGQVDLEAWSRHEAAFKTFSAAVLDLREEMQNPSDGFAPVAEVLMEAARVAKQIRDTMQTTTGQTWQSFLDFRFHFTSIAAKGNEALRFVRKAQRLDDPFAFVDKPAAKRVEGIDTTPTLPKPPNELIEAAGRQIPAILANVPRQHEGTMGMESGAHLVTQLQKTNHILAAAQWAIHEAVQAGRLQTGLVPVEFPSVKNALTGEWHGGGRNTKSIPKGKPTPFDCFKVIATDALWKWWDDPRSNRLLKKSERSSEGRNSKPLQPSSCFFSHRGATRTSLGPWLREPPGASRVFQHPAKAACYDPFRREPTTFGELVIFSAQWASFAAHHSPQAPVVAHYPDHHFLEFYCKDQFGSWGLDVLPKLRARYAVATSKNAEEIDATTLKEMAEHLRCLTVSGKATLSDSTQARNTNRLRRGGRPKLGESKKPDDQAKFNVYGLIRAVKVSNPAWGKKEMHKHFKGNKDFEAVVKSAGLKFGIPMFHTALVWISENPTGQETRSGNVS